MRPGRRGLALGAPFEKGGGLPLRRAARRLQLLLEPIALFSQAIPFVLDPLPLALDPFKLAPQPVVLLPQPLVLAFDLVPRRRLPPPRHRHGSKKAYLGPRIYNALRCQALTRDGRLSETYPVTVPLEAGLDGQQDVE